MMFWIVGIFRLFYVSRGYCMHSVTPPPNTNWGDWKISNLPLLGVGWGISKITGGIHVIPNTEFQGAQWFSNSLNSFNCSRFFLVLETYLKNPPFRDCSGIVLEFRIFDNQLFRLQHFRVPPVWISYL